MASPKTKQHVPVFISSTYQDLQLHRAEVERTLIGLEQIVKGMEHFGSSPDTPLDECLKQIVECKLFILILGVSYGSIEKKSGKSFTEIEYDFAISKGIPVLAYLADSSSTSIGIALDSFDVTHAPLLADFKSRVTDCHTVSFFTSIADLGKRIANDVPRALASTTEVKVQEIDHGQNVGDDELRKGGELFERFWLRPSSYAGEVVPMRLRINQRWRGWKVKDELIKALGLQVNAIKLSNILIIIT